MGLERNGPKNRTSIMSWRKWEKVLKTAWLNVANVLNLWEEHDWHSSEYVSQWAERQDKLEVDRKDPFRLMIETIPYGNQLPIRILDVGAGYGALTLFILNHFSEVTVVCQDGSEEMAKLGHQRMARLQGRFSYVLCDFSKQGWSRKLAGPFEIVVSSMAIHNVRSPKTIASIYKEIFSLVNKGGCFLNYDRATPSLAEQLKWLREAEFQDVKCFWRSRSQALLGGFKR